MIYADNDCPENGIEPGWKNILLTGVGNPSVDWLDAEVVSGFSTPIGVTAVDEHFRAFLASTSLCAVG